MNKILAKEPEPIFTIERRSKSRVVPPSAPLKLAKSNSSARLENHRQSVVIKRPLMAGRMQSMDDGDIVREFSKLMEPPKPPPMLLSYKDSENSGQFSSVSKEEKVRKFFRTDEKREKKKSLMNQSMSYKLSDSILHKSKIPKRRSVFRKSNRGGLSNQELSHFFRNEDEFDQ